MFVVVYIVALYVVVVLGLTRTAAVDIGIRSEVGVQTTESEAPRPVNVRDVDSPSQIVTSPEPVGLRIGVTNK